MKTLSTYLSESNKNIPTLLWIDDLRDPNTGTWVHDYSPIGTHVNVVWVKSYKECVRYIENNGMPDAVCFDHDLGETGHSEKTGYDCAKFIVKYCEENDMDIPDFEIQSSNPVGRENINSYMNNWHKFYMKSHRK